MCTIKIYKKLDKINLKHGGILLNGYLSHQQWQMVDGVSHIQGSENQYNAGADNTVIMHIDE